MAGCGGIGSGAAGMGRGEWLQGGLAEAGVGTFIILIVVLGRIINRVVLR